MENKTYLDVAKIYAPEALITSKDRKQVKEFKKQLKTLKKQYRSNVSLAKNDFRNNLNELKNQNIDEATLIKNKIICESKFNLKKINLKNEYENAAFEIKGIDKESLTIQKGNKDDVITMSHVNIGFKRGTDLRVVVEDFNLAIKRGEIFGLVGESGSGKTTVGRSMMRIIPILKGQIRFNGHLISGNVGRKRERELKTKIQMIFQDPSASLNDRANIDYIVSEGLRAFHLFEDEKDRLEKVTEMMERVGLRPEHLKRYPHEFSGGQRQRVGIARAMLVHPEVVVADEPISALDVSIRAQVLNLIKEFQKESNMTVIFIAHDLSVVKYISDRIGVIYGGRLVELANANRLFEVPLHPYTKSLLSAIPLPDPQVEKKKKIITYNPFQHHYTYKDIPQFYEVEKDHYVRCDLKELEEYKKFLKEKGGKK